MVEPFRWRLPRTHSLFRTRRADLDLDGRHRTVAADRVVASTKREGADRRRRQHGRVRHRRRMGVRGLRRHCRPDRQALSDHRTTCGSSRARVGRNIAAAVLGHHREIRPFRYEMLGQFAAIGRQRAVATLFGLRFSGFIAWLLWRGAYVLMLPRLDRKVRVLLQWLLDTCFARDTVQLLTLQSVRSGRLEELMESARVAESSHAREAASTVAPSTAQSLVTPAEEGSLVRSDRRRRYRSASRSTAQFARRVVAAAAVSIPTEWRRLADHSVIRGN